MYIQVLFLVTIVTLAMGQFGPFTRKQGECPPYLNVGICDMRCFADIQCKEERKCCRTACGGTFCTSPVKSRVVAVNEVDAVDEKPGDCPRPSGPWVCSSRCAVDSDCRGRNKCCKNRCGALACTKPAEDEIANEVY